MDRQTKTEINISPLRRLVWEVWEKNADLLNGGKVLEIGCGPKSDIKRLAENNDCQWFGLDVLQKSIATHIGSVNDIPFEDNFFDIVIASQSIEHWYEYLTTFEDGLGEINRVLKTDGILIIDYPVHLHGHPIFMLGINKKIYNLFNRKLWETIFVKSHYPDTPYHTWSIKRAKLADQFIMGLLLRSQNKASYIEQIIVKKINAPDKKRTPAIKTKNTLKMFIYLLLSIIRKLHGKTLSLVNNEAKL